MADCPICGDRLGFGGKRIVRHARDARHHATVLSALSASFAAKADEPSQELSRKMAAMATVGEDYFSQLHFVSHNVGTPGPNYRVVGEWLKATDRFLEVMERELRLEGIAMPRVDVAGPATERSMAPAPATPAEEVMRHPGPCPRCKSLVNPEIGRCQSCGFGEETRDPPRDGRLFGPAAGAPIGDLELSVLGPCYNCWTLGIPMSAAVTFRLPQQGLVAGGVLCSTCDTFPYNSWLQNLVPLPEEQAGHLIFQVIGICANCGRAAPFEMDLTDYHGKKMVPMSCSDECQVQALRRFEGQS